MTPLRSCAVGGAAGGVILAFVFLAARLLLVAMVFPFRLQAPQDVAVQRVTRASVAIRILTEAADKIPICSALQLVIITIQL